MIQKIKTVLLSLTLIFGFVGTIALPASAAICSGSAKDCIGKGVDKIDNGNTTSLDTFVKNIINVLLFVVGIAAVVMIIIGGLRYVVSGGDQSQVTGAKNTILYSVVGLVVAALAYAIVNFVVDKL